MKGIEVSLRDQLAAVVIGMGYEFVGCEMHGQGHGALLRIYIDKENGVTIDDCSKVSRQISAMLDVEDPIQGRYHLEISSPGFDRPLFEISHFQKYAGHKAKLRLLTAKDGRRNMVGILIRVEGSNIYFLVDGTEIMIPFSEIEKAKLIGE